MLIQLSESEESLDEDGEEKTTDSGKKEPPAKKYVPPRIAPMHYGLSFNLILLHYNTQ